MKFRPIYLLAALPLVLPVSKILTASTDSLFSSYAIAQEAGETDTPKKEEFKQRRQEKFSQLNLTPEQTAEIDQIRQQGKRAKLSKREEFQAAREKMDALMASDASDDELRAHHQVLQDLRQATRADRFESKLQIRQVLTLEQRTQMVELNKQRKGRFGRRHHW